MEKTKEYLQSKAEYHDNQYWDLYDRQQRYETQYKEAKRLFDNITADMEEHKKQNMFFCGLLEEMEQNKND